MTRNGPASGGRAVEYRPLSSLEGDPRNPKAHDVSTITASVGRFGYLEPIVLDGRTGRATERLYAPDRPRHGHQP